MPSRQHLHSLAKRALADRSDPQGLAAFVVRYLEWLAVHNYSASTIENREVYLGYFVIWCTERGLTTPKEITKPILERYQPLALSLAQEKRPAAHLPRPACTPHPHPRLLPLAHAAEPSAVQPGIGT